MSQEFFSYFVAGQSLMRPVNALGLRVSIPPAFLGHLSVIIPDHAGYVSFNTTLSADPLANGGEKASA